MSKSSIQPHETEWIPYTTMVEVPKLNDAEREELLASLREAEEDIKAGRGIELSADEFGPWFDKMVSQAQAGKRRQG